MRYLLPLAAVCVTLAGCATSTNSYVPPMETKFENSRRISQPFDSTWDKLVRGLSGDFFVINNIDKSSRIINISFSSNRPSEFANCGRTTRTFTNARGEHKVSYFAADSAQYTDVLGDSNAYDVRRNTKLDGRTNIYVAPIDAGTEVVVNTRYVISIDQEFRRLYPSGMASRRFTWDFSTKSPYRDPGGQVVCFASGELETRILRLLD